MWQPSHFAQEWARLVDRIKQVRAGHVIVATVPQVTIAPIARGVAGKARHGSRFFPYYTRPWITDEDFDVDRDPWIDGPRPAPSTRRSMRSTRRSSTRSGPSARTANDPRDWYLFDLGALLDRMAFKRYLTDPRRNRRGGRRIGCPHEVVALARRSTRASSRPTAVDAVRAGLFSLDGVHPTTISAGVIAHEVVRIMDRSAGVQFVDRAGRPRRQGERRRRLRACDRARHAELGPAVERVVDDVAARLARRDDSMAARRRVTRRRAVGQ